MTEAINAATETQGFAPTVKMNTPEEAVESIPYLLGYRPERSIVVVCVRDGLHRLTMRHDIPEYRHAPKLAKVLADHAKRAGTEVAVVAAYPDGGDERRAADSLVQRLRRDLENRRIRVKEALVVQDGRWWSHLCDDPRCCPPEGTPVPDRPGIAAAAAVLAGKTVQPSRDALYDRLAPVGAEELAETEAAAEEAVDARLARRVREDETEDQAGLRSWRAGERRFLRGLLDRYLRESPAPVSARDAGRAVVAVHDLNVRDWCALWWQDRVQRHASIRLWADVVRHAPTELRAPAATLLAGGACLSGEGAFANVALEAARESDPQYSLAGLLQHGIHHGVPPEDLRHAFDVPPELLE